MSIQNNIQCMKYEYIRNNQLTCYYIITIIAKINKNYYRITIIAKINKRFHRIVQFNQRHGTSLGMTSLMLILNLIQHKY